MNDETRIERITEQWNESAEHIAGHWDCCRGHAMAHAVPVLLGIVKRLSAGLAEPAPRVWPQDHATDVTVLGTVLTNEPGPEVSQVIDGEGDRFSRYPGSRYWRMRSGGERYGWDELIPPVRRSAS